MVSIKKNKKILSKPYTDNGTFSTERLSVKKTYKLFVNGSFPRSESGRVVSFTTNEGQVVNFSRASRKDFRDSVVAARSAFINWKSKSAFNRSQILYRIAETMEGRKSQFVQSLQCQGLSQNDAIDEVNRSIDTWVYYAGWADKYVQVFSSVNPVEGKYFNFSYHEPCGVCVLQDGSGNGLQVMTAILASFLCGGNTCIIIATEFNPLVAVELAEVLSVSDLPAGVCNILTTSKNELALQAATHMDVNTLIYAGSDNELSYKMESEISNNVKRYVRFFPNQFNSDSLLNPYCVLNAQELKTTWHPISI